MTMKKIKLKDLSSVKNKVRLAILIDALLFVLTVFFALFNVGWDFSRILPGWSVMGTFFPVREVLGVVVTEQTPGAWYDLGFLITSGVVNIFGFLLYFNTLWMRSISLKVEALYRYLIVVLSKFTYLLTDKKFKDEIGVIDLENKISAWKTYKGIELEEFYSKQNYKMIEDMKKVEGERSTKTKKWLYHESKLKEQLTDEWINQNIKYVSIRYPRIYPRLIVHGGSKVEIQSLAIEDIKQITRDEIFSKILFSMISFAFTLFIVALITPAFRDNLWAMIKDFVAYLVAVLMNIYMGYVSGQTIHESRTREAEDRLSYIRSFIGEVPFNKIKEDVYASQAKKEIEELEMAKKELLK